MRKEPSPCVVLLCLKSVEMMQSGPVCPCSQTCDSDTLHTWLQRTKVADSLWAIKALALPEKTTIWGSVCLSERSGRITTASPWPARKAYCLLLSISKCPCVWVNGAGSKPAWFGPVCHFLPEENEASTPLHRVT